MPSTSLNSSSDDTSASSLQDLVPEAISWSRVAGSGPWDCRRAERESGTVVLTSELRLSPEGDQWRSMSLTGPKVDVQTLFVYPPARRAGPLLAAEIVTLGARTIVAVIDAPVLTDCAADAEAVRAAMRATRSRFALTGPASVPSWYEACRSGYDIFLRPEQPAQLAAFRSAAADVGRRWSAWSNAARSLAPEEARRHSVRLATYRIHHRENSPGVPILTRLFGAAWTAAFLDHFF